MCWPNTNDHIDLTEDRVQSLAERAEDAQQAREYQASRGYPLSEATSKQPFEPVMPARAYAARRGEMEYLAGNTHQPDVYAGNFGILK